MGTHLAARLSQSYWAGCEYCPGTKSSQDETELSFELGQFDPSWDPFDTKVEGVTSQRLSSADIKLFNGQVIVESDPEYIHADRQKKTRRNLMRSTLQFPSRRLSIVFEKIIVMELHWRKLLALQRLGRRIEPR